ncbi:MAG TPA: hypothetical protein VEF04_07990, partial [Blastocatellia bacterium]|nr:hypothetical protein [Blastocatellia bacterium]
TIMIGINIVSHAILRMLLSCIAFDPFANIQSSLQNRKLDGVGQEKKIGELIMVHSSCGSALQIIGSDLLMKRIGF